MRVEILVVDDDPKVLRLTGEVLQTQGYEPTLSESPEKAIEFLKKNPNRFSVILLDWKLRCPIDGDMMLKMVKHLFPDFRTPIIFVTAHTGISSKYLMRLGAYDTLTKPVTSNQLIEVIERAIRKRPPEDPHRKAPAELASPELRKHEIASRIVDAVVSTCSLAEAARKLGCSTRSLYRWLHKTGLDHFVRVKEPQNYGKGSS